MRKGLGIALVVAAVAAGVLIFATNRREASVEDHLKSFHAAQRKYDVVRGIGLPTAQSKVLKRWYKLRRKREVDFLNEIARHREALEDLGYLETRAFVVSNRFAFEVQKTVGSKAHLAYRGNFGMSGLVTLWCSPATNRIWVLAPKADMPKWEEWIREADVRGQMTND